MSRLSDLKAALEAKREAMRELRGPMPISDIAYFKREEMLYAALGVYHKELTEDTVAALIAVAEGVAAECDQECDGYDGGFCTLYCSRDRITQCLALAPLVKEVGDDHA